MTTAYARGTDPGTSHDAARKTSYTKKEKIVYDALAENGTWMTSLCLARYLKIHPWHISPRLKPLERKGLVERGEKKPVLNTSGKVANLISWRAKKVTTPC
jgi:Mn-dependent DtxR family transcriptional regulator